MWAYAITAPGRLERVQAPDLDPGALAPGRVLVRLRAGGICGSDLPAFAGRRSPFVDALGSPGFPLHEVVGDVVATTSALAVGTRVVGWAEGHRGLAEFFVGRADALLALAPDDGLADVPATVVQPLCTVLHALDRLPDVAGQRVAVLGQGPIGLLFSHALKARGAAWVTGVDRVDRRPEAADFGVDEAVWDDTARWAAGLGGERPAVVVEAIGHQTATLEHAVEAVAPGGTVLAFGVPEDTHYPFPFTAFFRKNATLLAGVATHRSVALAAARAYLREHPDLLAPYVTDVLAVTEAQRGFELAARPAPGQLKVVLEVR